MVIKKIEVCHGPTCGPAGARRIQKRLEEVYGCDRVIERECCGRCKFNNSIVVDQQIISNLDPKKIDEQFIADPTGAIARAKEFERSTLAELDEFLEKDELFP